MSVRSNYFINPKFQKKIVFYFLSFTIVSSLIFFFSSYFFISELLSLGRELGLKEDHIYFKFINQHGSNLYLINTVATFFIFCVQIGFGVFMSHKIAGPLYRLTNDLNNAESIDDIKQIKPRQGDFFQEVFEALNNKLSSIESKNKKAS
jgi:sensor histidine kinase YesM